MRERRRMKEENWKPEWAREIRDQAVGQKVPFLFKQWSGFRPKSLGRELDGKIWDEYPTVGLRI
jgi:protein gp37